VTVTIEKAEVSEDVREFDRRNTALISDFPLINRRQVATTVHVQDGQTIVIGGLMQRQTVDRFSQVPYLSAIPVIGKLFERVEQEDKAAEVAIFISPRIIRPVPLAACPPGELLPPGAVPQELVPGVGAPIELLPALPVEPAPLGPEVPPYLPPALPGPVAPATAAKPVAPVTSQPVSQAQPKATPTSTEPRLEASLPPTPTEPPSPSSQPQMRFVMPRPASIPSATETSP
jgi:hypothetical protein